MITSGTAMETIDKLERTIESFVKDHGTLRKKVQDDAEGFAGTSENLKEANDTIRNLQETVQELEKQDMSFKETEQKKEQIKEQITQILDKIEVLLT